jgi:hypothetical protein
LLVEKRPGLYDKDDWYGWWQSLHHSDLFAGELARCAVRHIEDPDFAEGVGTDHIEYEEGGRLVEVEIGYLLEQFPGGRIFHVQHIRSPGDPERPSSS